MNTLLKSSYLKGEETLLHYIYREPRTASANPPLLLLLHGVGSNEKDLFAMADHLPENFLVVSARAPYTQSPDSYAWYDVDFSTGKPVIHKEKAEKSRMILIQFISQLKEQLNFDSTRIYVCGFSQGGIMAYSLGLTRPDRIKGIAVMSGRLLEEVKPMIQPSPELKNLKVFIAHGTSDPVLGVHYAREAASYLKALGLNPNLKEYYQEGHHINDVMLGDLRAWLDSLE